MESWLSGRKHQFTKLTSLNWLQGFESLTLRILELARDSNMELFSERNNIRKTITGPEEMPEALRNRLWNVLGDTVNRDYHRNDLIKKIWSDFYKKDVSELHGTTSYR